MWCVVLLAKGDTKNGLIPAAAVGAIPDAELAKGLLKRATAPELIGTYKYEEMTLYLFGYKTGRANTENKHELPPPHDKILLFGDAVLIAAQGSTVANFDSKQYKVFYKKAFGGFEDLGDEDTEDEEDEEDEEEEEEVEDEVEEEDEEVEEEVEVEEEEDETPKKVVRVPKIKRGAKKVPLWFNVQELEKESYEV